MGKVIPASEMALRRVKKALNPGMGFKAFVFDKNDVPGSLVAARKRIIELDYILRNSPDVRARENAVIESSNIRIEILGAL